MQEKFRTQALGFHKKDVVNYIYEVTREKEENEKAAAEQIETLAAERDALRAERDRLAAAQTMLEEQLHRIKAELTEANIQKSRVSEEINECRRIILDNEREFNIKNEQIHKLIAENEDYAEKCRQYSEIARDVGKTIMEAKRMASEIVEKAKSQASEIRGNIRCTVTDTLHRIGGAQEELQNVRGNLSDMNRVCENRLQTVEQNLGSLSAAVSGMLEEGKECAHSEPQSDSSNNSDDPMREFF